MRAAQILRDRAFPGLPVDAPISDTPIRFSESAAGIRTRAPQLGEHTDEILGALGYSAEAIAALRRDGVV